MIRFIFYHFFALILLTNFSIVLCAQTISLSDSNYWPTTPDTSLVIGYGEFPFIVSDNAGGAIVVFRTDSPWIIKVKRVDKWGVLKWNGWNGVIVGGTGDWKVFDYFNSGDIAEDGSGGVFVGFSDIHCNGCGNPWEGEISYATVQRIDHDGNKLWGDGIKVTTIDSIYQIGVQVQDDGIGGCVVSWLDDRNLTGPITQEYDLYVQRIDLSGNLCWEDSALKISGSPNVAKKPIMVRGASGNTFIRWNNRINKINKNGVKLWEEFGIAAHGIPATIGIPNNNGGAILAGLIYDFDLFVFRLVCQNLDSLGQKLWGNNGIILADSVNGNQSEITGLVLDLEDNVLISYYYSQGTQPNVYLQKLTMDGTKLLGNDGVLPSGYPSSKSGGRIIFFEDSLLYAWNDERGGAYVQKLDALGNIIWSEDRHFSTNGITKFTHDGYGGIIKVNKLSDFAIRLSKISKNGIIGEVIDPLVSIQPITKNLPNQFQLFQNYPNPFNPSTTIKYYVPYRSEIILKIYNILGQEVKLLINELEKAGLHTVRWDGTNNSNKHVSSGVYIYRLETAQIGLEKKLVLLQ